MNSPMKILRSGLVMLFATVVSQCPLVSCQSYDNTADIFKDVLVNSDYNTEVRPVLDQTKPILVDVGFQILSIVQVNEVEQSFVCNGFMAFFWADEKLRWNSSDYGGQELIHPVPEAIWRPRVILMNTLGSRDLFGDDKAPINVNSNGMVSWIPGGLFPTSCNLQMTNYPYDEQTCIIKMVAMSLSTTELKFISNTPAVGQSFYTENGEWDLVKGYIKVGTLPSGGPNNLSSAEITFVMKRRPFFFVINILLPVVFLSFLNILVFIIPVESGEKIGYGITVLLALSVFLSIVSGMIPRSSLTIPKVTVYVFLLLIISLLTVIDSIVIVYLQHKEEKEEIHQKAKANFQSAFTKIKNLQRAVSPMPTTDNIIKKMSVSVPALDNLSDSIYLPTTYVSPKHGNNNVAPNKEKGHVNKYKLIGRHIDCLSFVFFFVVWLAVTLGFLFSMSQS